MNRNSYYNNNNLALCSYALYAGSEAMIISNLSKIVVTFWYWVSYDSASDFRDISYPYSKATRTYTLFWTRRDVPKRGGAVVKILMGNIQMIHCCEKGSAHILKTLLIVFKGYYGEKKTQGYLVTYLMSWSVWKKMLKLQLKGPVELAVSLSYDHPGMDATYFEQSRMQGAFPKSGKPLYVPSM